MRGRQCEVGVEIPGWWSGWRTRVKGKVFKMAVRPAGCGLETVALTKTSEAKLKVEEMKMLRVSLA